MWVVKLVRVSILAVALRTPTGWLGGLHAVGVEMGGGSVNLGMFRPLGEAHC